MNWSRSLGGVAWLALTLASSPSCRSSAPAAHVAAPAPLPTFAGRVEVPEPGVEAVADVAALPLLRPGGLTRQVSSADPAGGNEDGFAGHSELYVDERGEHVVFDDFGPGCVYRAWFTAKLAWLGRIRVYVDDLDRPVVDEPFLDFFRGERAPFVTPLVLGPLASSGGFVSYVPICYERRAKITLDRPAEFYGITYRRYDLDHPVRSFKRDLDVTALAERWRHPERDPKPVAPIERVAGKTALAPGESRTLLAERTPGAVWNLALDVEPFDERSVAGAWLVARWDDHEPPDVEAPLGLLFGSVRTDRPAAGLLFGRHGGRYVMRLPMPFWSAAEVRVENRGRAPISVAHEIELLRRRYPAASGYFTAIHHRESPTTLGRDYLFAEVEGAGSFVGVSYAMRGSILGTYMEGDERFHVDGRATPALHGTGTEDYFNGGWYFLFGRFSGPLHGAPYRLSPTGLTSGRTGAYRVHLGDLVSFMDGARFGIEHDRANESTHDDHASVAYLYLRGEPGLAWCDALELGDVVSERFHRWTVEGTTDTAILESALEGSGGDERTVGVVRAVTGTSTFEVTVDPANQGVLLRRRFDQRLGRQTAEVLVDGSPAGTWYDPVANPVRRWGESELLLPASLTRGKSRLRIALVSRGGVPWSEQGYRVGSVLRPCAP